MRFKKIINSLFLTFVIINIFNCKSKSAHPDKIVQDKNNLNEFQALFVNMRSNADKLVFKRYYLNPDSNFAADFNSVVWRDSTNELKKIENFNRLFTGIEDRGYCCCISCHYTVSFYKDKKELGIYCVDTTSLKGIASFFDESYQTSYHIDLSAWNSYLQDKYPN